MKRLFELVGINFPIFLLQLSDLDIEDLVIGVPKTADEAKRRYIYAKGGIHELPTGWNVLTRHDPLSKSLFSYLLGEVFTKKKKSENSVEDDESVHDFFQRRFQSKEVSL